MHLRMSLGSGPLDFCSPEVPAALDNDEIRGAKGLGTYPHCTCKRRLAEFLDRLNVLSGAEVSDEDNLHFANGIERDESVMVWTGCLQRRWQRISRDEVMASMSEFYRLREVATDDLGLQVNTLYIAGASVDAMTLRYIPPRTAKVAF